MTPVLSNAQLAELLARAAEGEEGHRARALRRASRSALQWPDEAAALGERGVLTELRGVGPWVARMVESWLEDPPSVLDPPQTRRGFLTAAEVRGLVDGGAAWQGPSARTSRCTPPGATASPRWRRWRAGPPAKGGSPSR